jgi:YVTN family beta-propeller protein
VDARRPSIARRLWPVALLGLLGLVLVAAKLSVRSVATGEAVLPGVAGAPVLGPGPTATATPSPARGRLRVQVLDPAGLPVSLAVVEVRDRFNAVAASQETGTSGEVLVFVPAMTGYTVTARREGFAPGRVGSINVDAVPTPPPAPTRAPNIGPTSGSDGQGGFVRQPAQLVQVRLEQLAVAAAPNSPAAATVPRIFVGHSTLPRLSLIDPVANLLLKHSDPLGQGRLTLQAPARDSSSVYATWNGGVDIWVLRGSDLTVERTIPLNAGPISAIAVSPRDGRLWVATYQADSNESGTLLEIDPGSFDIVRRVNLGQLAAGMRFRPDGSVVYVRHRSNNALSFVDIASGTVAKTVRLSQWPTDIALTPDGARLYLVFLSGERVMEIDAQTGETSRTLEVGVGGSSVLAHPDGKRVFIVNQMLGSVQVLDAPSGQITDLIPVGRAPQGLALVGSGLYVANSGSGSISVVDVDKNTIRETINTGGSPSTLLVAEKA